MRNEPPTPSEPAGAPVAHLDRAAASYGGPPVLRDVSLRLDAGQIYVLLGPNGAGKSTLIRLLTGILAPSAGRVEIVGGPSAVGLAPQEIALYPWLTARENVFAFARLAGLPTKAARERARWALEVARCSDVGDTPVARLSGGYRRRANIAAALVGDPRLLILDEPMAGVDLEARRAIGEAIRAIRGEGRAVLLVTHDFDEADALADRAGVLMAGRLVDEGAPAELVRRAHGRAKRIEIVLAEPPGLSGQAALAARGAVPRGASWVLFQELEDWNVQPIVSDLAAKGLRVKEARLRQPGLESVYDALSAAA